MNRWAPFTDEELRHLEVELQGCRHEGCSGMFMLREVEAEQLARKTRPRVDREREERMSHTMEQARAGSRNEDQFR